MQPFRVLEHTADIGFEAFGRTREEVYANAARALTDLIVDLSTIRAMDAKEIQIEAADAPSLLVDWLSEILYLFDTEKWLLCDFAIAGLSDRSLVARAHGEKFDPTRHRVKLLVKAITYHQLAVAETAEGWRAQVYVDI